MKTKWTNLDFATDWLRATTTTASVDRSLSLQRNIFEIMSKLLFLHVLTDHFSTFFQCFTIKFLHIEP